VNLVAAAALTGFILPVATGRGGNHPEKHMANASKCHAGPGTQGKKSGTGAMTELPEGILEENMVLSNRDKSQHSDGRGLDGKMVQTDQFQDHAGNRRNFDAQADGGTAGKNGPASRKDETQDR
jgi:hypothetical protein